VNLPPADWPLDEALVSALVTEQAPQHAGPVRRLGRGWDNEVFLVGQAHVARLPRRAPGVPLLRNEHRWLGELPPLPIPIPSLVHRGQPSERFRHPWSLCRFHPGERVDDRPLDRSAAVAMGSFLAALHHPAPPDAPGNDARAIPLEERTAGFERDLVALGSLGRGLQDHWSRLRRLPPSADRVWLHGDLHPGNVLHQDGAVTAIIDFGDLCAGDRAVDLSFGWMAFGPQERGVFFDHAGAGPLDRERSRGWALALAATYVAFFEPGPFRAMGERTLQQIRVPS